MKKNILYIWHRRPFTNVRSPLMRERCIFPQEMYSHEKDLFFLFLREICHILFQNHIQLCIPFLICKLAVYTCHLPGVAGKSQQSFLSVRKIVRIPGTVLVFWSGTANWNMYCGIEKLCTKTRIKQISIWWNHPSIPPISWNYSFKSATFKTNEKSKISFDCVKVLSIKNISAGVSHTLRQEVKHLLIIILVIYILQV